MWCDLKHRRCFILETSEWMIGAKRTNFSLSAGTWAERSEYCKNHGSAIVFFYFLDQNRLTIDWLWHGRVQLRLTDFFGIGKGCVWDHCTLNTIHAAGQEIPQNDKIRTWGCAVCVLRGRGCLMNIYGLWGLEVFAFIGGMFYLENMRFRRLLLHWAGIHCADDCYCYSHVKAYEAKVSALEKMK